MSAIITAISNVMAQVGSVKKDGVNEFHRYKYAAAADVLHKLQPLLAKEGLVIFQHEKAREFLEDGAILAVTYEFTIAHKGGEIWPEKVVRTGMSPARNSKGGFDDKALNKCHTAAHKYFHITLFEIPTGDYDDADGDEDKPPLQQVKNIAPREKAPPPVQPSKHPETGDYAPHKIEYADDPIAWGSVYVASIKTSPMLTDLAEWRHHNKATLDSIKKSAPKIAQRIEAAEKDAMNGLTGTAEAAE